MYGAKHGEEIPFGVSFFFANKKTQSVFVSKMQVNGVYFAKKINEYPR